MDYLTLRARTNRLVAHLAPPVVSRAEIFDDVCPRYIPLSAPNGPHVANLCDAPCLPIPVVVCRSWASETGIWTTSCFCRKATCFTSISDTSSAGTPSLWHLPSASPARWRMPWGALTLRTTSCLRPTAVRCVAWCIGALRSTAVVSMIFLQLYAAGRMLCTATDKLGRFCYRFPLVWR